MKQINKLKSSHTIDMCNGSIAKKMIVFALPLMLSSILQLLFNAADVIVVGKFAGDASLAAVGSTTSLINLTTNLFIGLSVGANVLTANYFAASQINDLKKTIHTAMTLSVIAGLILTVIGIIFAPYILVLMQTPDDVFNLAVIYLRTYFSGMTAVMIYNFGSAVLRAVGDTKRPLYYLTVAGVVNVCLNLIFVIKFNMGVLGVGLATAISQVISALLIVVCLIRDNSLIKLNIKDLSIDKHILLRIIKIGLPAGIQGMLFSLANIVIQSSVNTFGTTIVAGNSASQNIEGFAFTSMNAFHQAAVSFTGQNAGARKYERINKILYTALGYVLIVGLVFCGIYLSLGKFLIGFYTDNSAVVEAGVNRLIIIACSYAICGMMDVVVGSLRGLGYSVMPMIVSLVGVCALRLIWIAIFFRLDEFHKIEIIYYTYPVSWTVTLIAHLICFSFVKKHIRKKWLRKDYV